MGYTGKRKMAAKKNGGGGGGGSGTHAEAPKADTAKPETSADELHCG